MTVARCATRTIVRRALLACALAVPVTLACEVGTPAQEGPVISGRIVDPHGLRTEDSILMVGSGEENTFSSVPVPVSADGSFVTAPLKPATYVLEVIRTPHSASSPARLIGFATVRLGATEVTDVTITIRRDTALVGRFRMESDDPSAKWPPSIHVTSLLVLDRVMVAHSASADGAPGGRFVLRNMFGPRILRCGYELEPGRPWWPARILLDGEDITNVPTDFSRHEGADLEVVFTQHPTELTGTVGDVGGAPMPEAWVLAFSTDRRLWHDWASTSKAVRAAANGRFSLVLPPGEYFVRALSPAAFASARSALRGFERLAVGAQRMGLADRELKSVHLLVGTLPARP